MCAARDPPESASQEAVPRTKSASAQAAYPHLGILRHTRTFLSLLWYCFLPAHRDIALFRGPLKQAEPDDSRSRHSKISIPARVAQERATGCCKGAGDGEHDH